MGGDELALALALEGTGSAASPQVTRLLALAETLVTLPDPEIDPRFAARLEARLLEETLEEEKAPRLQVVPARLPKPAPVRRARVHPLPRRRLVVRRSLVAAAVAIMLAALPVVGSAGALPGSPFYRLKLGLERVELFFAGGPQDQGFKHLEFAGARLGEATELVALGMERAVPDTLARMQTEQRRGAGLILAFAKDRAALARAARILQGQSGMLTRRVLPAASSDIRDAVLDAVATGKALASRIAAALRAGAPVVGAVRGPASASGGGDTIGRAADVGSTVAANPGGSAGAARGGGGGANEEGLNATPGDDDCSAPRGDAGPFAAILEIIEAVVCG